MANQWVWFILKYMPSMYCCSITIQGLYLHHLQYEYWGLLSIWVRSFYSGYLLPTVSHQLSVMYRASVSISRIHATVSSFNALCPSNHNWKKLLCCMGAEIHLMEVQGVCNMYTYGSKDAQISSNSVRDIVIKYKTVLLRTSASIAKLLHPR